MPEPKRITMTAMRCIAGWAVFTFLLVGAGRPADARVLALESHSIPRTGRAAKMTAAVIRSLGPGAPVWGRALTRKMAKAYGPLPRSLSPAHRARLLATLKLGVEASLIGDWDKAVRLLLQVKTSFQRAILSISRSKTLFAALQRARLTLANCYLRRKQPKRARKVMVELILAQPDINVTLTQHPPPMVRLHLRVKADLDRKQSASLVVKSDPPGALVFLSGRFVGVSPVKLDQIYLGEYDLLVIKDNRPSRIRRIHVRGRSQVRVDLALHLAIASSRFAGLELDESPGRDVLEMRFAMDIATRIAAKKVVLIGLRRIKGREVLVGKAVSVSGRTAPIKAYVYVDRHAPTRSTLRSLGRFLGGMTGRPGPGVLVGDHGLGRQSAAGTIEQSTSRTNHRRRLVIAGFSVVGVGLAATLAGGVLLGIHGRTTASGGDSGSQTRYKTDTEGYVVLGVGLGTAIIGATLLLISRSLRSPEGARTKPRVWLAPRAGGSIVFVGGTF